MSRPGGMLSALRKPLFARFYLAQPASQFGDAIAWIALAVVAVELEGADRAPAIVAIALTLRVAAYVALGPVAGVIADRVDRRTLLAACHLGRAVIVAAMVVVTAPWQVYVLILLLNVLTALFTPANQATVPMIAGREHARSAFALSAATTEIFGIVGPGLAGVLAIWVGGRQPTPVPIVTCAASSIPCRAPLARSPSSEPLTSVTKAAGTSPCGRRRGGGR